MINPKTAIILIALGSVLVIIGILFYFTNIYGATGMIIMGVTVELVGGLSFLNTYRKYKRRNKDK